MNQDSNLRTSPQAPGQIYRHDVEQGVITADATQAVAIDELDRIYALLLEKWSQPQSLWAKFQARLGRTKLPPIPGLYLWGGVGRGKTYLMDLFFHSLPSQRKMRMHFHRFMLMVHQRLNEAKGQSNPLALVAGTIAAEADVLCFDEFFVSDIGDAMILANLLDALFDEGIVLVATSNLEPGLLYENGLQRQKFLPAIALLRAHTRVLNVDGGIDYRLRSLDKVAVFHHPLNAASARALLDLFVELTRGAPIEEGKMLNIQGRQVQALRWCEDLVWFDFETLCGGPRGAADYIELAREYHTVFVSDIPLLHEGINDKAKRFITMVDEFYDHRVKLVASAATGPEALYVGSDLRFPFARTQSRLLEMQTREYLGSAHHPD